MRMPARPPIRHPVQSRGFRRLAVSAMATGIGGGSVQLALLLHVFALTGSSAAVGILGIAQFAGLVIGSLAGATVTDRLERRRILLSTRIMMGFTVAAMTVAAIFEGPGLAILFSASIFGSVVSALHFPTRTAMIPRMVAPEYLTRAMSLEHAIWNAALVLGPIVGGFALEHLGLGFAYGLGLLGHLVAGLAESGIEPQPTVPESVPDTAGLRAIRSGVSYIKAHRVVAGLLLIDLVILTFGTRRALFPAMAEQYHRGGGDVVGYLLAAIPAGALLVSLSGGWINRVKHQGAVIVAAASLWGVAIATFGASGGNLGLAVATLAVAGGAHIVVATLRATVVAETVPEAMRGRVWGSIFLTANAGMRLGDLEAGLVGDAYGPAVSVVSGGLVCLVGVGFIASRNRELRSFTS